MAGMQSCMVEGLIVYRSMYVSGKMSFGFGELTDLSLDPADSYCKPGPRKACNPIVLLPVACFNYQPNV